jgi:hypothetical protein
VLGIADVIDECGGDQERAEGFETGEAILLTYTARMLLRRELSRPARILRVDDTYCQEVQRPSRYLRPAEV